MITEQDLRIEHVREEKRYINGLLEIEQGTVQELLTRAKKAEADNLRLQERVRELEELLDWIERYTGARFNQNHRLIAIRDQARQALQHKEKG